jgi:very-short-patch-repair endonuclease
VGDKEWRNKKPAQKRQALLKTRGHGEREVYGAAKFVGLEPVAQKPIGPYFADMAFEDAKIVIEVDGKSHSDRVVADARRDAYFAERGWRVYRVAAQVANSNPMAVILAVFGPEPLRKRAAEIQHIADFVRPAPLLTSHRDVLEAEASFGAVARTPLDVPLTVEPKKRRGGRAYKALMKKIDRHQKMQRRRREHVETKSADQDAGLQSAGNTMVIFAPGRRA